MITRKSRDMPEKTEKSSDLFRVFPGSFFSPLTGVNRTLMELALSVLYARSGYGTSYTLTFEDACAAVEDALEGRSYEAESDEDESELPQTVHDTAVFILRRLRACGWLSEEIGENYQRFLHFEDYAAEFLQALRRLSSGEAEEYSGYIYTIYQLMRSVDPENGDLALERAESNTEDLFRQLTNLNTNIKKYIQRLLDDRNRNDLHALMEMLLTDYQAKVVDRAYYNLTTRDNPEKYREAILGSIAGIEEDVQLLDRMARQRMERKASSYEEALRKLEEQLGYIEESFRSITGLMDEIDRKNHKYINSAIARITFLLEAHEDLEGKVNRVLKALIEERLEPERLFRLYRTASFDEESLYTMKKKRLRVKKSVAVEPEPDEQALREFAELLAREQRFSRQNVELHFQDLLGGRKELRASELDLSEFEAFTFLVLGYLYGNDPDSRLRITEGREKVTAGRWRVTDFSISLREKDG